VSVLQNTFVVRKPRSALVERNFDILTIGGLSIVVFALMFVFVPKDVNITQISWTMFYLGFVVNGPHFFASYWHIYVDNKSRLREPRYFFAAFIVPFLLVVGLGVAARNPTDHTLGLMVGLMYLSVGWHYVKQIFGVTLVSSAAHGHPIAGLPKKLLRLNLLTVWLMSWVFANESAWKSSAPNGGFYNVSYGSADIKGFLSRNRLGFVSNHFRLTVYLLVGLTFAAAAAAFLHRWVATGSTMAPVGWVAWASIYVWYLPVLYHPAFFYFVPLFHSLQYLLFSVTFSWNKAQTEAQTAALRAVHAASDTTDGEPSIDSVDGSNQIVLDQTHPDPILTEELLARARRQKFIQRFGFFVVFAVVFGAAGFHWLPEWLDRNVSYRSAILGGHFWVVAFNLFINIHHYFVDSVIWRGTNPQVRAFLKPRTSP
jgi:hypothetical protein